jgi:hypothetical protein
LTLPLGDDLRDLVGDILGEAARVFWGEDDLDGAEGGVDVEHVPGIDGQAVLQPPVEDKLDIGDENLGELFGLEIINSHVQDICKRHASVRDER